MKTLEEVASTGETIGITKHGIFVAQLIPMPPSQNTDISSVDCGLTNFEQTVLKAKHRLACRFLNKSSEEHNRTAI